jgi:uncharacterized membrane protein
MIFRNPQLLALLALLPLLAAIWLARPGRVGGLALALRLTMIGLLVVAMADPALPQAAAPTEGVLVLAVDQSDSLGEEGRAVLRERAVALARGHAGSSQIIFFSGDIAAADETAAAPALRAEQTDIAGALRAARGITSGGGRVVLLSDGVETRGDALAEARALAAAGVPVDTVTYTPQDRPEVWVTAVEAPATLREGETFTAEVVIRSTGPTVVRLELLAADRPLLSQEVRLAAGENRIPYSNTAGLAGVLSLRATVSGGLDTFARNNSAAATTLVAPAPRVLVVGEQSQQAAALRNALRASGVLAELLAPNAVPFELSALDPYEAVVLLDVPAGSFTLDQMLTLEEFVRDEGRGLIVAGGQSSFTLGAYKDTPLEAALPVLMTPPPRPERSQVTLLLIIDQSASMGPDYGESKFNMAKEAAILATESLRPEDRIGVLAFDVRQQWVVDFELIGSEIAITEIQQRVGQLPLGGGTDIYGALEVGLPALASQPGEVRHAVLLTDGRSFADERELYRLLVEQARANNITLSSIALGDDADTELLRDLAQQGAGRYHFAATPEDIPRLTLLESEIARTDPQVEGLFRAEQQQPHPALRAYQPNEIPQLGGYVATTLKPEAELVLQSPEGDPVLATWQYGLGRAVAWTPGIDSPWAPDWPGWPEYGRFWSEIIRYTLPEPDSGPLQVRIVPGRDAVTVVADAVTPSGEPFDLADTEAAITLPDGTVRTVVLRQTAPGRYTQQVALPADGPYAVEVRQRKDVIERTARAGYVQAYPAEYVPSLRDGAALLAAIGATTGGQELGAAVVTAPVAQAANETMPEGLWPWLLVAAALLWPVEIAVRRGWLRLRR